MVRILASVLLFGSAVVVCEGSGCRTAAGRTYYAPAASYSYAPVSYAPAVSYYPQYVPTYSVSYGSQTSPETVELFRLFVQREEAREIRDREREALFHKILEGGGSLPPPAKAPSKHPGLSTLMAKCADCHAGAKKGDITFLNASGFIDEGDNLARVLDAIDPFGSKAKGGVAHMPPKDKLTDREALAATSFLNRLPPPDTAKAPKKKAEPPY
jgi:hypothetical protein